MKRSYGFVTLSLLIVGLALHGCVSESSVPVTAPKTAPEQKATITGKIVDGCTSIPIKGAVLSVGADGAVVSVTSDTSGSFSLANVPVGKYQTVDGNVVASGTYNLTASLVSYNDHQQDSTQRYRDFYYNTVTITFTSVVDSTGLLGLVGSVNFVITKLNIEIKGSIVDQDLRPVPNAQVILFDQTVNPGVALTSTSTSASGQYTFYNVDKGIVVSIVAKSSDGTLQGALGPITLPCNVAVDSLRPQVTAERLMLAPADDTPPFVISLTPQNGSDVSPTNLQIVYTFSEPIQQTAYTRTDLGIGHGTILDDIHFSFDGLKKSAGAIGFSASWDPTFSILTLAPQGLVGSAKYSVDATTAFNSGKLMDAANQAVVNNSKIVGDFEVLSFTTGGGSTVPTAPQLVRRMIPGAFDPLDYSGGTVGLEWNYDPTVRSYNVYKRIGAGSFELLAQNVLNTQYSDNSGALYSGALPDPFAEQSVSYQVTGVSKDLAEGAASTPVTVADEVKPTVSWGSIVIDSTSADAQNNKVYYITVPFSEPLFVSSAENSPSTKYSFANTIGALTVTKADYLGFNTATWNVQLTVSPLGALLPNGASIPSLTVQNTVTDLNGNGVDTKSNSFSFPMYFFDSFESAWTGAGQIPAGWARTLVSGTANWSQKTNPLTASGRGGIPSTGTSVDGNAAAFFPSDSTAGATTRLESPVTNLSSSTSPSLTFYYVNSNGTDVLRVRYSTDNGTTWNTITTLTTTPSTAWQLQTISLAAVAGRSSVILGLEAVSDGVTGNAGSDIWVDKIYVHQ